MEAVSPMERRRIMVPLGGHTFEWVEPVRRVARRMFRDLNKYRELVEVINEAKEKGDEMPLNESLDAIDDALDFFYEHHEGMRALKAELDDADEQEIMDAFGKVAGFISAPFANTEKPESRESLATVN